MASAAVKTAVEARLNSEWSNLSLYELVTPNKPAASPRRQFLELKFPRSFEERDEMGPKPARYREEGGILLELNVLTLDDVAVALGHAEELRDLFRDEEFAGVITFEASPPVFDEHNRNGVFYRVPVAVPYQFFYTK